MRELPIIGDVATTEYTEDKESKETGRQGDSDRKHESPCLPLSLSPCLCIHLVTSVVKLLRQRSGVHVPILPAALTREFGRENFPATATAAGRTRSRKSPLARGGSSRAISASSLGDIGSSASVRKKITSGANAIASRSAVSRSVPPSAVMPPTKFAASCLLRSVANAIRRPPPVMSNDCVLRVEENDVELMHALQRLPGFRSAAAWRRPAAALPCSTSDRTGTRTCCRALNAEHAHARIAASPGEPRRPPPPSVDLARIWLAAAARRSGRQASASAASHRHDLTPAGSLGNDRQEFRLRLHRQLPPVVSLLSSSPSYKSPSALVRFSTMPADRPGSSAAPRGAC